MKNILHFAHMTETDWQNFNRIIQACKQIQQEHAVITELKRKRKQHIKTLTDFCRKCTDVNCAERVDCEIKKAYDALDGKT